MKTMLYTAIALFGLASSAPAQEEAFNHIGAGVIGSFTYYAKKGDIRQEQTRDAGISVTYRRFFSAHHGIEFNYAGTRNTFTFVSAGGLDQLEAHSNAYTAAYVLRANKGKLHPFTLAGVGAMYFHPEDESLMLTGAAANSQTRGAFVYGAGVDYDVTRHVSIRGQYRGLIHEAPDFGVKGAGTSGFTHTAEPSFGVGFRF